jgi:hypothetical protein
LEETMKRSVPAEQQRDGRRDAGLEVRYGEIGIPAVAAAMRYQSEPKKPEPRAVDDERFAPEAA